jgi:ribonuclease P protein component
VIALPPASPSPFPPGARLRVSAEFQAVFKTGRRLSSPHFRLFAWLRAAPAVPRLGIAVSRKVDKRAVGRNRLKRLARECFRAEAHALPPGDFVLIAQPGASALDASALRTQFDALFERARALKPDPSPGTMPPSPDASDRPASDP